FYARRAQQSVITSLAVCLSAAACTATPSQTCLQNIENKGKSSRELPQNLASKGVVGKILQNKDLSIHYPLVCYPGGHVMSRPPSRCRCRWNTDWPERGPTLYTVRYPSSMPRSRPTFAAMSWQ